MTFQGDPHRTLGVAPGASLNEIKSAYRRLAKQYHPDAAGERALPRFLAVQAAYEQLVDGEGRLRPTGWGSPAGQTATPAASEPWRADPARARASRDAWRARRSGSGGTAGYRASSAGPASGSARGPGPGPAPGAGSASGPGPGPGPAPGPSASSRTSSGGSAARGERHRSRRGPRKATPGSTTYDEAAETPLDPSWEGGAWYGPSSGTYWTINPREYADPRKHGPEYLARARRAAGLPPEGQEAGADPGPAAGTAPGGPPPGGPAGSPGTDPPGATADWDWTGAGPTETGGDAGWGAKGWTYDVAGPDDARAAWMAGQEGRGRVAEDRARPDPREGGRGAGPDRGTAPTAEEGELPDLEALVRRALPEALLAQAAGRDPRRRLLVALLAWPPIGYGLGGLVSTVTGCAQYAASCPEPVPVLVLLVQPLVVAALYAVPVAAAVGAFASLAALAVAVPAGAVLAVGALPRPAVEPAVLAAITATTYAVALAAGAIRLWRAPRAPSRP